MAEVVVGVVLALIGLRSLVKLLRAGFEPDTPRDRLLFPAYVAARAGWWFGLAFFFLGLAFVDEPRDFLWFLIVPLSLAGLQLVTGVILAQSPRRLDGDRPGNGSG